jgi:uncharacterized membrane protein
MHEREWTLPRNCSLAPRQVGLAYGVLCLMSFAVASICVIFQHAWCVLGYAAAEMLMAALAFLSYARHATDREHIALKDGCLLIDRIEAGELRQTRLDPCWTHVALPRRSQDLIALEARGVRIQVGRFVTASKRRQVAQELRQALGNPFASAEPAALGLAPS